MQLFGRLNSDICNIIPYLPPDVKLQIKLTKGRRGLYLMDTKADSTTKFQCPVSYRIVNRIRPNSAYLIAHNATLAKGDPARYNTTSVALKKFTYSAGPISLSIDNAVLRQLPKGLLFNMFKNNDFLRSVCTNT